MSADKEESTSGGCDLYLPGHQVHYIQTRKAMEDAAAGDRTKATLVVAADGVIVVSLADGNIVRYRTHSTRRVRRIAKPGDGVIVCESFRTLGIPGPRGATTMFCIALDRDELRPCSASPATAATPEDLAEQLATRGGFVIPGRVALGHLIGRRVDGDVT
jgi:hypothetical protein